MELLFFFLNKKVDHILMHIVFTWVTAATH